jgi:hypothetical protein
MEDEDIYFEEDNYDDFIVTSKKGAGAGSGAGKKSAQITPYTSKHIRERERKIENGAKKR